jgi:hypothetical protein
MTFGQQAGPPASPHQVRQLLELLHDAGHRDFRDARGPMGFSQRQAGGRFTRDEATAFIEQLETERDGGGPGTSAPASLSAAALSAATLSAATLSAAPSVPTAAASPGAGPAKLSAQAQLLRHLPAEQLAAELRRRGWTVAEP